ncbi:MAG: hypothetical protein COX63_00960 [Candidatus Diapherotrites archaeon CG_4_10_14_0_2_um_filter_31_5]|nr:MAG: hypothetical protein COX63_00960 [Candidatus Diapherotrites archaeon CG_4_10_14_0_2_um_filter_31_5]
MRNGNMLKSGDVVLAQIQFLDSFETKKRPAVVLFKEFTNFVVAGITSNLDMKGIPLAKKEGAIKDSVIKTNYIFTITEKAITKKLFNLSKEKRTVLYNELDKRIARLKE